VTGPENCIINCEADEFHPHRGFYFQSGENSQSIVEGLTIAGGFICGHGAGIYCENSSPTKQNVMKRLPMVVEYIVKTPHRQSAIV